MAENRYHCESPVLLMIFNRPILTRSVLESVKAAAPRRLYIAADGPRDGVADDIVRCADTRRLVELIDWDCEVKLQFQESNLGVGAGVKAAIDWFFKNEERGIILEDDTVPTIDFFKFCDEMLARYHDDDRIGSVCGTNSSDYSPDHSSYFFARGCRVWGWASWARSWKNFDFELSWLRESQASSIRENLGTTEVSRKIWDLNFKSVQHGRIDTWDWQWVASLASQNQLSVYPSKNLVSNIGFGEDATHTFGTAPEKVLMTAALSWPLTHPRYVVPDLSFTQLNESTGSLTLIRAWRDRGLFALVKIKKSIARRFGRQS